ncbi:M23 family metallopeptidase [Streptomyces niger]|uniref:M23 family metallopeptidase n=1 Tax=Streptomyces niger TaxID=66373 RepID=UPI0006992B46|nr:M23 family metallopeptidase [Streptomyces niger]
MCAFTIMLGGLLPCGLPPGSTAVDSAAAAAVYEGAARPEGAGERTSTAPAAGAARHARVARRGAVVRQGGETRYASGGPGRAVGHGRAGRLARARLEVLRLGVAAGKVGRTYKDGLRAAKAERLRARLLTERLRRERRTAAALRRTAGLIAAQQYRIGSGLSFAVRTLTSTAPEEVLRAHRLVEYRQRALAAEARTALRTSRVLAAGSAAAADRAQALDARQQRLAGERERVGRSLDRARGRLWRLVAGAAESRTAAAGSCGGPPHELSSATGALATAARPAHGWTRPVTGYALSASFGGAGAHWSHRHTGQDFAVPVGTPVRSAGQGRVAAVECGGAFGTSVVVRHKAHTYTQYAHLSAVLVRPGQRVRAGQPIALSGNTGNSTGPHLHFEVRRGLGVETAVEPLRWLRKYGVRV